MKKLWSGIVLSLMIFPMLTFSACKSGTEQGEDTGETPLSMVLGDFESMSELSEHFTFENRFGRVTLTDEADYVTHGKSAAKLEVYGDYNAAASIPTMNVNLASFSESGAFDLTRLQNFTFDLYNATGSEQYVEVALTVGSETTNYVRYTLSEGKNKVTATYNASVLSVGYDLKQGSALIIRFPKPIPENGGLDPQLHYTFGIDHLTVNYLPEDPEPLEIVLDENEVCSFDKAYQEYVIGVGGIGPCEGCMPQVSINTDLQYCKDLEGRSLKVVLPTGVAPLNDGWPYVYIINAVWDAAGLREHALQGYELVFDVYSDVAHHFGVEVHHETYSSVYLGKGFDTVPRSWTEVRVPLTALFTYNEKGEIEKDYTVGMETLAFSYSKFSTADKTIYFDNFRFEKAENA